MAKSNSENVCNFVRNRKANLISLFHGKCCLCGFDQFQEALEFHHVNPEEKELKLSSQVMVSLDRQINEARKCILVCANCHRGIHAGYYEVPECVCPICQFIEYSEYDLSACLLKEYGIPRDEVFAEVKQFNKRRKKLYENEYITYVCKKFELNPTEIVAEWKDKFGTYSEFKKWLRG